MSLCLTFEEFSIVGKVDIESDQVLLFMLNARVCNGNTEERILVVTNESPSDAVIMVMN